METAQPVIKEFKDAVQNLEAKTGQELFDEERLATEASRSLQNFTEWIGKNDFFNEKEQQALITHVDEKMAQWFQQILNRLNQLLKSENRNYAHDIEAELDVLGKEASRLIFGLIHDLENQTLSDMKGILGITNAEFRNLLTRIDTAGALPTYRLIEKNKTADERSQNPKQSSHFNIEQALAGRPEGLKHIDIDCKDVTDVEMMAVESAYNMSLEGACHAKMQLLIYQLYKKDKRALPSSFALDGDWGQVSQNALNEFMGMEYTDQNATFKALIQKYKQEFGVDHVDLFLTPDEINNSNYKFKNKGVYRGLKVDVVKQKLKASHFDIKALAKDELFGKAISQEVLDNYITALHTLNQLTDDPNIKASILATMIMEKGLSSWLDSVGLGRGDRKDYVYWTSRYLPKASAMVSGYSPLDIDIHSAGIMQINYKTAQQVLQDNGCGYMPKDLLVARLRSDVVLSVVLAFLVYRGNFDQLREVKKKIG